MKKQPVYAGDKFFPTMSKLADWLGISKLKLSNMFKDRDSIFYNGTILRKAQQEPKPQQKTTQKYWDRRPKPVLVDGIAYNSCREAEEILGFPKNVLAGALNCKQKFYKGHTIEYVCPSDAPKQDGRKNGTGVYCENLNKHFSSINDAARFAKADGWTMSKKMEFAGKFIDSEGNTYIREKPMKTIRVYKNTGAKVKRNVTTPYTRTPNAPKTPVVESKNEVPQIVKDAIIEKLKDLLKHSEINEQMTELMKYAGLTKVVITLIEDEK